MLKKYKKQLQFIEEQITDVKQDTLLDQKEKEFFLDIHESFKQHVKEISSLTSKMIVISSLYALALLLAIVAIFLHEHYSESMALMSYSANILAIAASFSLVTGIGNIYIKLLFILSYLSLIGFNVYSVYSVLN